MLTIDSLTSYYDTSQILTDVSLEIDDGETIAVLGRNGAGKTTLIRSILDVGGVRTEGTIKFKRTNLVGLRTEQRVNMGIAWVPENRRIFPNLTVLENLRMAGMVSDSSDVSYNDIYDIFPRLAERKSQLGGTLSGGEQQMLAIGRALLTDPEILLVDEPFEGLMPSLVREVRDVLEDLSARFSILIIEQKPEETLSIANEAYILEMGNIVHHGDSDELLDNEELLRKHIGIIE